MFVMYERAAGARTARHCVRRRLYVNYISGPARRARLGTVLVESEQKALCPRLDSTSGPRQLNSARAIAGRSDLRYGNARERTWPGKRSMRNMQFASGGGGRAPLSATMAARAGVVSPPPSPMANKWTDNYVAPPPAPAGLAAVNLRAAPGAGPLAPASEWSLFLAAAARRRRLGDNRIGLNRAYHLWRRRRRRRSIALQRARDIPAGPLTSDLIDGFDPSQAAGRLQRIEREAPPRWFIHHYCVTLQFASAMGRVGVVARRRRWRRAPCRVAPARGTFSRAGLARLHQ